MCYYGPTIDSRVMRHSITVDEVREYETSRDNATQDSTVVNTDERVLTFSELKDLIESGRVDQIPNNKIIPETFSVSIVLGITIAAQPPSPGGTSKRVNNSSSKEAMGSYYRDIALHVAYLITTKT